MASYTRQNNGWNYWMYVCMDVHIRKVPPICNYTVAILLQLPHSLIFMQYWCTTCCCNTGFLLCVQWTQAKGVEKKMLNLCWPKKSSLFFFSFLSFLQYWNRFNCCNTDAIYCILTIHITLGYCICTAAMLYRYWYTLKVMLHLYSCNVAHQYYVGNL
jgi:hypothetical protein